MRRVEAEPAVCILFALLLLVLPLRWLVAAVFAAAFHELCHILTVRLCGGRVFRIRIGLTGAAMETDSMSLSREMLCALAGPAGSFLLLLIGRWFPEAAVCGVVHGIYNMLPVYPLDGGRALRCFLKMTVPGKTGERLAVYTGNVFTLLLLGGSTVFLIRSNAWFMLALFFIWVLRKLGNEKELENRRVRRYNRRRNCK